MTTEAAGMPLTNAEKGQLMRWATYASVATATILIAAKIVAYLMTDSVSLLSTLLDSLLDAAASLVNLIAVRHALSPADREHRFGHGKAEPLAALGQSAFIAGSAAFLIVQATGRIFTPHPIENTTIGIGVMVVSILATIVLVAFQRHVIRRTGSVAIKADSLHYFGDLIVNTAVIVALSLVTLYGWRLIDPLFGIGIALYIIWTAWTIAASALDMLMDRELADEERAKIRAIALANPAVRAVHDLRTRASGPMMFVQLHLEMDGDMKLIEAHEVADSVEAAIRKSYPEAEIIIHQDPAGVPENRPSFR
jgi:ferrous-iron efflux pump FieF